MTIPVPRQRDERGSVLVFMAISILALTAFMAFVIDYGVFWVSRAQAQNAADAGALAGAIARAFDDYGNLNDSGPAKQAAFAIATSNAVWSEAPSVQVSADVSFPICSDIGGGDPTNTGAATPCVRVDVHRTLARGNQLPTYFGRLVGVTSQDVKATAWAQVLMANESNCLRPIAIPDRWGDYEGDWPDPDVTYEKYDLSGNPVGLDSYSPPDKTHAGGFEHALSQYQGGLGTELTLTESAAPSGIPLRSPAVRPGSFIAINLPGGGFDTNMGQCNGEAQPINGVLTSLGTGYGSTAAAKAQELIAADNGAHWDVANGRIKGSCVSTSACPAFKFSPRVIALPVFDVDRYDLSRQPGHTLDIHMVNVVGFFIESVSGSAITGRITFYPGQLNRDTAAPAVAYPSSFLRAAALVR